MNENAGLHRRKQAKPPVVIVAHVHLEDVGGYVKRFVFAVPVKDSGNVVPCAGDMLKRLNIAGGIVHSGAHGGQIGDVAEHDQPGHQRRLVIVAFAVIYGIQLVIPDWPLPDQGADQNHGQNRKMNHHFLVPLP